MCGIWALFGCDGECMPEHYVNSAKIGHRGPDSYRIESVNHIDNCCLAFYRLAINDDLHGMQPMRLKKYPYVWLIYNGEIYNFKKVGEQLGFDYETHCDGEAIIHLYMKGGIKYTASMLDGVFAFCIVDVAAGKMYLGRDSFGIKPLYKLKGPDGCFAACSEAKGLVELQKKFNDQDIIQFQPGWVEGYDLKADGKVSLEMSEQFHHLPDTPKWMELYKDDPVSGDIFEHIRQYLTEAVRKRLMSDRRLGCMLSGGLDSSLVAALVCKLAKEAGIDYPIQMFSVGMEGSPDIEAAKKVNAHIGGEHHIVIFTPEEGIRALEETIYHLESYDSSLIRSSSGMYILSQYISKETDTIVLLTGEGADEVAMGYSYFQKAPTAEEAEEESLRILRDLYLFNVCRADKMPSAHGLELRFPFLDHQFISDYASIETHLKQPGQGTEKYLIRKAFDNGLIPDEVLWRRKEAFCDGFAAKKSWPSFLKDHTGSQVSDAQLALAPQLYPINTPKTKEAFYYRQIFEKYFPGHHHFTPYTWMPKWIPNIVDPSSKLVNHILAEEESNRKDGEREAAASNSSKAVSVKN